MKICPICQSSKPRNQLCKVGFVYDSEFDLIECPDCSVRYMDPMPSEQEFIRFYSPFTYEFNRWRHESRADSYIKLLNNKQEKGRFLDIGCANGYFINHINKLTEWDVYGVELSEKPVAFAKEKLGLENVFCGDVIQAGFADDFFDFINIYDVLEHVPDPVGFMDECKRILKPDGMLYLIVPNGYVDSLNLIRYYNKYKVAGTYDAGHVFYFPSQSLETLFDRAGFAIDKSYTFGIKNGLRNLGLWPKRSWWAGQCAPRTEPEIELEQNVIEQNHKKYPNLYYKYRYMKHRWKGIPGLQRFGLNYRIILVNKD